MDTKVWSRLGARWTTHSARWASLVFVGVLALALVPRSALAATINVACGDIPGLKAAITSASPGDTVSLAPACTYALITFDNSDGSFGPNGLPQINKLLTIEGNGSIITNSGASPFRFFDLGASGNLTLNQLTLTSGNVANQGGAILLKTGAVLTATRVKFSGNVATAGGGAIYAEGGTTLTVTEDTFSNNSGGAVGGGGILSLGITTVTRSTFTGDSGGLGGAIMVGLPSAALGNLSVINSTFTANSAVVYGNAIKNFGTATVVSSTLSDNVSSTSDGAISSASTITLQNTIVANGTPSNCSTAGAITDGGYNISWPDTTCPGLNVDPNLGPLANNGGPTQTMALPLGSPAVDGVPATGAGCPPTDQRGVTRPQGPSCDVGAFELQVAPTPTPVPPTPTAAPVPGPPSTGRSQT